jgi:hypothetical protein
MLRGQNFDFFSKEAYLRFPGHLELAVGTSNFLGDLGGKDGVGSNDFADLELSEFNPSCMVGYRHSFHKNLYGRFDFDRFDFDKCRHNFVVCYKYIRTFEGCRVYFIYFFLYIDQDLFP